MVRSVKSHHNDVDEEEDYHEFASSTPHDSSRKEKSEGRSGDQKLRSKHSETEQRRRSKINERFQMLRNIIPENDQKRDRASFLLEVIQYVQFLQERLQIYEGTYPNWSPDQSKLTPWRSNSGPNETFIEQTPLIRNECNQEENIVGPTPPILANSQNSVESIPHNIPLEPNMFENLTVQHDVEHLASHSQSQWYTQTEQEDLRSDNGEDVYSQGLLNTLTRALQSSGVDLSQANISVQLDIARQAKDEQNQTVVEPMGPPEYSISGGESYHGHKRHRAEEN